MRKYRMILGVALAAMLTTQMAYATVIEYNADVTFDSTTTANVFGSSDLTQNVNIVLTFDETQTGAVKDVNGYFRYDNQTVQWTIGNKTWTSAPGYVSFHDQALPYSDSVNIGSADFKYLAYQYYVSSYYITYGGAGPDAFTTTDIAEITNLAPTGSGFSGRMYFKKKVNGLPAGQGTIANLTMVQEPAAVPEPMAAGFLGFFGVILMAIGLLRKGRRLA